MSQEPLEINSDGAVTGVGKIVSTVGFRITDGKGFHITFANGWMISTQFGAGSYIEKRKIQMGDFSEEGQRKSGEEGSSDAEIMIFPPDGQKYDEENPVGYQSPEQFSDLIAMIREKP